MENFKFQNPVKIIFGKNQISTLAQQIPPQSKVLLTYGGGSLKKNGVYDQVIKNLAHTQIIEFGGIEPNPEFQTLMKAVHLGRKEKINFILAVGGGSVLDGSKFIAAAIPFQGDEWNIVSQSLPTSSAIPLGAVLTLAATGSEMNCFSVVSRSETNEKLGFANAKCYPLFSILDPETTFSLPQEQVANGIVDAFIHVMEQYLTFKVNAPLQDRMAESIALTLIEEGIKSFHNPKDYDSRANYMWAATMALNGLIGVGVPQDWTTHTIGHQITSRTGLAHARTLAIILPALWEINFEEKKEKLKQMGERLWGMSDAKMTIQKTREFFHSLGVSTELKSSKKKKEELLPLIIADLEKQNVFPMGERGNIDKAKLTQILEKAW